MNAKEVTDLKLSGSDAMVIVSPACDIGISGIGELLEGVLYEDVIAPHVQANKRSLEILQELHPDLSIIKDKNTNKEGPSERTIVDLLFSYNKRILAFGRNPEKTSKDWEELKSYVEIYFHCGKILFNNRCQTPYKVKYHVMVELLRCGAIRSLYDHMSEGTEHSNHETQSIFAMHSMRDGGYVTRHQASEFTDIFTSFAKALQLGIKTNPSKHLSFLKAEHVCEQSVFDRYLAIARDVPPMPKLNHGKTESSLSRMQFTYVGKFTKTTKIDSKKISVTKD